MFSVDATSTTLAIVMSAELEYIDAACMEASGFIDGHGLGSCRFAVLLGLREALANAIIHGSGSDAARTVRLELACAGNVIHVSVEDEGSGFDWASAGTAVPDPWSMGGRGLPIIMEYFDEMAFNESGNAIRFSKQCRSQPGMSIIKRDGDAAVVEPGRDIVATMADDLKKDLKELLNEGVNEITIDMQGVDLVDSIGIGLLIATHNSLTDLDGALRLTNVNGDIANLFGRMRLDKHFRIVTA